MDAARWVMGSDEIQHGAGAQATPSTPQQTTVVPLRRWKRPSPHDSRKGNKAHGSASDMATRLDDVEAASVNQKQVSFQEHRGGSLQEELKTLQSKAPMDYKSSETLSD